MKEIHYFYKITNLINGHYYYGIRTCHCLPGKDPYMGSGVRLHKAYRKYGIENFKKEVIRVCKTREDLLRLEYDIVDDNLINDNNCYNIVRGGSKFNWKDMVPVKIIESNEFTLIHRLEYSSDKSKYLTTTKGFVVAKLKGSDEKFRLVDLTEYRNNKDKFIVSTSLGSRPGTSIFKNKFGEYKKKLRINDSKVLSGDYIGAFSGRKHTEETKDRMSKSHIISSKGSRNSQYGKIWIYNSSIKKNLKIYPDELDNYLKLGWNKGRRMKF